MTDWPVSLGEKTRDKLAAAGLGEHNAVLAASQDELAELPTRYQGFVANAVKRYMDGMAERLSLTPHGMLMGAIFGAYQGPVEAADEPLMTAAIEGSLDSLHITDDRTRALLDGRYGLEDWEPIPVSDLATNLGMSVEVARTLEKKHSTNCDIPAAIQPLQGFKPYRCTHWAGFSVLPMSVIYRICL